MVPLISGGDSRARTCVLGCLCAPGNHGSASISSLVDTFVFCGTSASSNFLRREQLCIVPMCGCLEFSITRAACDLAVWRTQQCSGHFYFSLSRSDRRSFVIRFFEAFGEERRLRTTFGRRKVPKIFSVRLLFSEGQICLIVSDRDSFSLKLLYGARSLSAASSSAPRLDQSATAMFLRQDSPRDGMQTPQRSLEFRQRASCRACFAKAQCE